MRLHLFEFEDYPWFPNVIRSGGTDYLRYFLIRTELYKPCISLIQAALTKTQQSQIVDLCSGGGGYIEEVYHQMKRASGNDVQIILTDKFPNHAAYEFIERRTSGRITYRKDSIDVFKMPDDLKGLRVMFSALHHFKPNQVREILEDAVRNRQAICFFDGGDKGVLPILGLIIIHPIAFVFFTPFFKPFKLSRLLFTYLIPVIPLYTIWDGMVSILRMYNPQDLKGIVSSLGETDFEWSIGRTKNRFGLHSTYLIGYPKK